MREGDIVEARQFYQRAVAYGDPEAALAMGRSYDPIYFARIEKNADPDAGKALDWYNAPWMPAPRKRQWSASKTSSTS